MRPALDLSFIALLLLTALATFLAETTSVYWVLFGIAALKSLIIQAVFMDLHRRPLILLTLTASTLLVGIGVGLLL